MRNKARQARIENGTNDPYIYFSSGRKSRGTETWAESFNSLKLHGWFRAGGCYDTLSKAKRDGYISGKISRKKKFKICWAGEGHVRVYRYK